MPPAKRSADDSIQAVYDFSRGERGKHNVAFGKGANVAVLDPDVAKAFPNSASVNQALRLLLQLAKKQSSAKR
jgi:hypothetical protein